MNLSDKPACLVTGGSSGIGLATSLLFAQHGYRIAMCGRDKQRLQAAGDHIRSAFHDAEVLIYQADVGTAGRASDFADFAIGQFGRVDVLVNNAGFVPRATIEDISLEELSQALNVNVIAPVATIKATWQTMAQQDGATIINISSMSATDPFPGLGLYGSCKAFLETLTLTAAREGEAQGIRAYGIRAGAVETPLLRSLFPDFPAANCVQPSEIAQQIWKLVRDPSSRVSGEIVEVRK